MSKSDSPAILALLRTVAKDVGDMKSAMTELREELATREHIEELIQGLRKESTTSAATVLKTINEELDKVKIATQETVTEAKKEVTKDIDSVSLAIKTLRNENTAAAAAAEVLFKTLNSKFDMFKNVETGTQEAMKPTPARMMSRPQFFKKLFRDEQDREKYLNVLYTREEIEEASNLDEVKSRKKEDRISKIGAILYAALETKNRKGTFESIYSQARNQ